MATPTPKDAAPKDYVIESCHFIGPRAQAPGDLAKAIQKLAEEGQVGDSFLTERSTQAIKAQARRFGVDILIRSMTPGEKDKKKRRFRVWRSDGLTDTQVNLRIKERLEGQVLPAPKKCVPDLTYRRQQKPAPAPVEEDVPQR